MKEHYFLKKFIILLIIIILIVICLLLYSRYLATKGLTICEYKITSSNIPENFHGLKIVHLSDIHYGRITFEQELENAVNKINLLQPDIVVLTGDLIDKKTKLTGEMTEKIGNILKKINSSIGKYAIMGEHDIGFSNWGLMIENAGFINLNDTYDTIYQKGNEYLLIAGISSSSYGDKKIDEKLILTKQFLDGITEEAKKPKYKILLTHEPDNILDIDIDTFNLVLAGHSHNGQIRIPFLGGIMIPDGAKKYHNTHYTIHQTELYISGGIGVSNINFRLFNHPSINFYRLTNR